MSDKLIYKSNNPVYLEYINFIHKDKSYSLLLHSIKYSDNKMSAYSKKLNSTIDININKNDVSFLNNLLNSYNFKLQACSNCHRNKN